MRVAIVLLCAALAHGLAMAQGTNCPQGQGTLDGSPCLDSKMVSFLFCFKYTGKGLVEISQKTSNDKDKSMEVGVTGGGSGVILKIDGGITYKKTDVDRAISDVTTKIDPNLAGYCKSLADQSAGTAASPKAGANDGPARVRYLGPMGPLESGISYNQGDLHDSSAQTAQQCSNYCLNDDRCLAVTWINSQKRCWIKGSFTGNVGYSSDMVSARKLVQR
jgi:hypothetical protein